MNKRAKLQIRPYQAGDEHKILDLFRVAFKRDVSEEWWHWFYLANPVDQPRILLAWDGEILAAHYAVCPIRLSMKGQAVLAGLSAVTMTAPPYMGQGLFPQLAEGLYRELSDSGYACVLGFPNINSHVPFVEKLKWSDYCAQHTLALKFSDFRPSTVDKDKVIDHVDPAAIFPDMVMGNKQDQDVISVDWDRDYWKWRLSPESGRQYHCVTVSTEGGTLEALLVWKLYGTESADIVYFNASNPSALATGIAAIVDKSSESGCTELNLWASLSDPTHRIIERLGFRATMPVTYFGGRWLSTKIPDTEPDDWRVTMLMSDVY